MDHVARPSPGRHRRRRSLLRTRKRSPAGQELQSDERDQPRRTVRQAEQPRLQGDRRRHRLLQAARQPVRRAGALAPADPADAGLGPAPDHQALRARSVAAGQGRHRRARSAAARCDVDLRSVVARRERRRARLGLRDADVRRRAGAHRLPDGRHGQDAVAAQRAARRSRGSSIRSRPTR